MEKFSCFVRPSALGIRFSAFLIKTGIQFFIVPVRFELLFAYLLKKFLVVARLKQVKVHIFAEMLD